MNLIYMKFKGCVSKNGWTFFSQLLFFKLKRVKKILTFKPIASNLTGLSGGIAISENLKLKKNIFKMTILFIFYAYKDHIFLKKSFPFNIF